MESILNLNSAKFNGTLLNGQYDVFVGFSNQNGSDCDGSVLCDFLSVEFNNEPVRINALGAGALCDDNSRETELLC